MIAPEHIRNLIVGYNKCSLTPPEIQQLMVWRSLSEENEMIYLKSASRKKSVHIKNEMLASREIVWEKIRAQYPGLGSLPPYASKKNVKVIRIALLAAASVFLIVAGIYLLAISQRIVPGKQQAYFFSYKGYFLGTDKMHKADIALSDEFRLEEKEDGEMAIVAVNHLLASDSAYEKLIVPNGGRFFLQIPGIGDFRFNAQSALEYPAHFDRDSVHFRAIGEIYVELNPTRKRTSNFTVGKFSVDARQASFNIDAHPGEPIKITLISGKLSIRNSLEKAQNGEPIILHPGEQFIYQDAGEHVNAADTLAAVAWKNGRIYFHNETIQVMMRALSKWYDFEYNIDPSIENRTASLDLSREAPIDSVLHQLNRQGIHCRIYFGDIIIKP